MDIGGAHGFAESFRDYAVSLSIVAAEDILRIFNHY